MNANNLRSAKQRDHVVAVVVVGPDGVPLVRDPTKDAPLYWKAPGGRGEPGESAEQVAVREVKGETGVALSPEKLRLYDKKDAGSHTVSFFLAEVPALLGLKKVGDGGEEVRVFSLWEILALQDLFPPHSKILKEIACKV